jgi:N-acetylmuramoyl-L-alanine amidase
MHKRTLYILLLVLIAATFFTGLDISGATNRKNVLRLLKSADLCRKSLLNSSRKMKYRHNWMRCLVKYKNIYSRYKGSDQAAWALYHSGKLYTALYKYSFLSSDLDKAVELYREITDNYKEHRLADDAQYKIGMIAYEYRKNPSQAYVEFLKVDIKFPSGDMRPKAKIMLDKLAVMLSKGTKVKGRPVREATKPGLANIKSIRHWSSKAYTRVVVDLDRPVKYDHHLLAADPDQRKPRRLYLDLKGTLVSPDVEKNIVIKDGLLRRARAGQNSSDTVRIVLDMVSVGEYKVFHLHDPFRIVADVKRVSKTKIAKSDENNKPKGKHVEKGRSPETNASLARQLGLNVKTIVIDPGHGGKDPGCHLGSRLEEKDIVLNISKILASKIKAKLGCNVFLTRRSDVFLPLERRTAIANMKKADLFISLHVNAHRDRRISGIETYFLNMATNKRAVMLAARENATSQKNISDLQTILNDLMLNSKIHESSRLAQKVQSGMISETRRTYKYVKDLGVKQAPFYVLIGAQMPSILVEVGFLTNSTEKKRLTTKLYKEKIAEGIADGISSYIKSIDYSYQGG